MLKIKKEGRMRLPIFLFVFPFFLEIFLFFLFGIFINH
jgi:hypothetical protein